MLKNNKRILDSPFVIWALIFIIVPLCMVFYYGITNKTGAFTLENIIDIASAEHAKALWLSLLLSFIATVICLLLGYPLAAILARINKNQHLCG